MKRTVFLLLPFLVLSCVTGRRADIALNRTAVASSNYDANLTAQLLTDGIFLEEEPAFVEVISSEGEVGSVERENALDGDVNSRNILTGSSGWIEWRFRGYEVVADEAEVLFQEALKGGRGGPKSVMTVPVEIKDDGALHIDMTFPHEGRWRVKEVKFFKDGEPLGNLLPSGHFTSAWTSGGCQEEWVMVDLGAVCRVDEVTPHWLCPPDNYEVEISRDGQRWREAQAGRCRYVRILMHGDSTRTERFSMTELEVLGPGKETLSEEGWKIQRASEVFADGAAVSSPGFDVSGWLPATVPGTVLANYIRAGAVPDPAYGDNWSQISDSFFNSDFWYRKEFDYSHSAGKRAFLDFDGINWKADLWLNGVRFGRMEGAFIRGHFDVDTLLREGRNVLAVRILCNAHPGAVKEKTARWTGYNGGVLGADSPTFLASIGWDWMTTIRGRNCGIWNDVRLVEKGPAEVSDPLIISKVNLDGRARVTASVKVKGVDEKATLEGWIGDIAFSKEISSDGEVAFSPEDFPQLEDCSLALWWPNGYGEPVLHDAGFVIKVDGEVSDSLQFKAGIREVGWDISDGSLKLFVNGRRFIPQGGNWGFSEHNLVFGERDYDIALDYHRQMNLNMIRNWVGQVADEEFYEACDRYGVMVWQDFWLANPSDGPDPDDEAMFLANASDWVSRIRRHPSLALYCGRNEGDPPASLDAALRETVAGSHPDLLYISNSADGLVSGHGPYKAVPFEEYFTSQSGKFHSERGLPNVSTYESLCKMMPEEDRWPLGEMWGKHDFTTDGAQNTKTYVAIMNDTFGESASAGEFTALSQWLNYEGCKAIFESANSAGRNGLLLWMTHSSWPSLVFCTYDYYFEPTGAFFGCKKACEPLHIQYNPVSHEVEVVNICCGGQSLSADLVIYGLQGNPLLTKNVKITSPDDSTVPCFKVELPDEPVCILKLRLLDIDGAMVSENTYVIAGSNPSVIAGSTGNLKPLRTLPAAKLTKSVKVSGDSASITLRNDDSVPALLVRLILTDRRGEEILPVEYADNYFSLMPGEEKTVAISWKKSGFRGSPEIHCRQLGDFALRP